MKVSQEVRWLRSPLARQFREADVQCAPPLLLAPFSTRLPPELLDRLRVAAPQLGLRQGEIAASALDIFLTGEGF